MIELHIAFLKSRCNMAPPVGALARFLLRLALNLYGWFAVVVLSLKRWFSGNTGTAAEERIMTGRAWAEFCDTLKAAGATVLAPGAPRDAFNQAEGYRYLARLTRAGLENFVECADVEAPRLCAIANGSRAARVCIGSDNPDNLYESATIDGTLEYVVTGRRGTVGYLGFGTQSGQYGAKGGLETVDYIEADQLKYDAPPPKGSRQRRRARRRRRRRTRASRSSSRRRARPTHRSTGCASSRRRARRCSSSARRLATARRRSPPACRL